MAQTDVLNRDIRWDRHLEDAVGPDFGWERLRNSQLAVAKAAGGRPFYRTIGNGGHTTQFSWLNRSRKLAEYLKRWAEEHQNGFFTIIDHDGGGRHYVGTFTGNLSVVEAGNDRYNLQGWTFEETPGAPMLQYPTRWDLWSVMERPWDDWGDLNTAFTGNWTRPPSIVSDGGFNLYPNALQNREPIAGDTITHEYRGYGFRLWANQGPSYGGAQISVDGLDYGAAQLANPVESGPQVVFQLAELPLDIHRVQIFMLANPANVGSGASATVFNAQFVSWNQSGSYAALTLDPANTYAAETVVVLSGFTGVAAFLNGRSGMLQFPNANDHSIADWTPTLTIQQVNISSTDSGVATLANAATPVVAGGMIYTGLEVMR